SDRPGRSSRAGNSSKRGWRPALPPAESSSGVCFYPIPTHSRHRLMPLCRTVSASPRHRPSTIISSAAVKQQTVVFLISAHGCHGGGSVRIAAGLELRILAHLHKGGGG